MYVLQVQCISPESQQVSPSYCVQEQPPAEQQCQYDCGEFVWVPSDWSPCSAVCAGGSQNRTVTCRQHQGTAKRIVPSEQCEVKKKPEVSRQCNKAPCTWARGPWSECSEPCGPGQQKREVCNRSHDIEHATQTTYHIMALGVLKVACKFRSTPVDSALCDATNVPADTKPCQITQCECSSYSRRAVCTVCTADGKQVDYRLCASKQATSSVLPVIVYLLFEGSTEDVYRILFEGRRRPLLGKFGKAISAWVVAIAPKISTNEIALAALRDGFGIQTDQFLVQLNVTTPAMTESTLSKLLEPNRYRFEFPTFLLRSVSVSRQCFTGYNSCGLCKSDAVTCPSSKNVLSSAINGLARVFWNGTTVWDSSHGQFYRPQFIVDGQVGENSLLTFRTADASGVLYFDIGRIVRATQLRINWFQQPAQQWELWVQEEAGFYHVKQPEGRRAGRKLRLVESHVGDVNEVQTVPLQGGGVSDEPLLLRIFEIRLTQQGLNSLGFAIEEVHLFGAWEKISQVAVVGFRIPSMWWVLSGIFALVCSIAILSLALPWLKDQYVQAYSDPMLSCGMFNSRWPAKHRCTNCNESLFRHLLQNPRSVVSETTW